MSPPRSQLLTQIQGLREEIDTIAGKLIRLEELAASLPPSSSSATSSSASAPPENKSCAWYVIARPAPEKQEGITKSFGTYAENVRDPSWSWAPGQRSGLVFHDDSSG